MDFYPFSDPTAKAAETNWVEFPNTDDALDLDPEQAKETKRRKLRPLKTVASAEPKALAPKCPAKPKAPPVDSYKLGWGRSLVGRRIEVKWRINGGSSYEFYVGKIVSYSKKTNLHFVKYDDGDQKAHTLDDDDEIWKLL